MFQAYTLNCAQAMRLDQQVGSLKVGALPCMFSLGSQGTRKPAWLEMRPACCALIPMSRWLTLKGIQPI